MSYTRKDLYRKVLNEYKEFKFTAEKNLLQKKTELYNKLPRIKEIDEELYTIGHNLANKLLNHTYSNEDKTNIIAKMKNKTLNLNIEKGELLSKNGFTPDYLSTKYNCNKCKDTGFIDNKECVCFKNRLIKLAYEFSNLNMLLDSQTFDNFNFSYYSDKLNEEEGETPKERIKNIYEQCLYFVKNFDNIDNNIFMYGPTGLGKTFLSSCIAKGLLEKGKLVFYQTAYNIFDLLEKHKFNKEPESQSLIKEQVEALYDVDLLIIDDLGTEFSSSFTNAAFFNLLNNRLLYNKKTIINTNLSMNQIHEQYSERVISRIFEKYIIFKFFGEDIRRIKFYNE
jgi:DNA replication protein DnaC